jgi:hypothetical protein
MEVGQMNLVRLPRRHFQTSPTGVQAFLHRAAIIKPRGPLSPVIRIVNTNCGAGDAGLGGKNEG